MLYTNPKEKFDISIGENRRKATQIMKAKSAPIASKKTVLKPLMPQLCFAAFFLCAPCFNGQTERDMPAQKGKPAQENGGLL